MDAYGGTPPLLVVLCLTTITPKEGRCATMSYLTLDQLPLYDIRQYIIICYNIRQQYNIICYTIIYHIILQQTIIYYNLRQQIVIYYNILYYTIRHTILLCAIIYYYILLYSRVYQNTQSADNRHPSVSYVYTQSLCKSIRKTRVREVYCSVSYRHSSSLHYECLLPTF